MRHDPHDRVERTRCAGDSIEDVLERAVSDARVREVCCADHERGAAGPDESCAEVDRG